MTTANTVQLDGGMAFHGSASMGQMQSVQSFHNAVANTMFTEHLGKECAVAIRRWYLENNVLHPHDSAPMSCDWSGFPCWDDFNEETGGQGSRIDQVARGEFAKSMICRALRKAAASNPAILNLIAEHADDDASECLESLLEMTDWTLGRVEVAR